jgi:two-component system response regulator DesR
MTASPAPLRIAIGEDNEDLAQALTLLVSLQADLQSVGHAATCAGVLELAALHAPDAYILDLTLADGSCMPLVRSLRAQHPACLIVVFTGYNEPALESACREAGCDAVLRKDGRPSAVLDTLRRLRG